MTFNDPRSGLSFNIYIISGAYKATLVQFLEVEIATPLLDLYFNKWVINFKYWLEHTSKGNLL